MGFSDMNDRAGRRPSSKIPIAVARKLRREATPQERRLWARLKLLREQGLHFRRQVPIENYVVDFACLRARLVVEIDGGQHNFDYAAARDRRRDARLEQLGYRTVRFWNNEVSEDIDAVVDTIIAATGSVEHPTRSPAANDLP